MVDARKRSQMAKFELSHARFGALLLMRFGCAEEGKVQKGERLLPRSRRAEGRKETGNGCREKPARCLPATVFAAHTKQAKGGRFAALMPVEAKQLSSRPWRLVALPSSLSLSRRTPASP